MPSKNTFTIKPIAELLKRYIPAGGIEWIDPFAGNNSPAELTNDHNPATNAKYHEIVEILIVAHGGHHNDTLVTVEQKL